MGSFAPGPVASSVWKKKVNDPQAECRSEGTHLNDATNSVEVQSPGCDCLIIVFGMEGSGEHTPFPPLGNMPLDLNHGAAIVALVNKSTGVWVASPTHVVSFSTASRTGGPGGGSPPFIPW